MTLEDSKRLWYSSPEVKFQIKEWTKIPRDVSIFQDGKYPRRYCVVMSSYNVDFIVKRMRLTKIDASVYASLIHYDFIEPNREENKKWREERENHITGIDFGIDFDDENDEHPELRSWNNITGQVTEFKNFLDLNNVIYSIWMSGKKGFQFIIKCEHFPISFNKLSIVKLVELQSKIANHLKKKYPNIDTTIYSDDRIFKCPYTVTGSGVVILPLTDDEYLRFINREIVLTPESVLKNFDIRDRGVFFRGDIESTKSFLEALRKEV